MLEQIKKMVADNLGVEESKITENASFKDHCTSHEYRNV